MTVLETQTRLRCARFFAKIEQKATEGALCLLAQRSAMPQPPPLASDGNSGCREAMLKVWGKLPPYKNNGRPPKHPKAGDNWQHLKVCKNLHTKDISTFCQKKVVFGKEDGVLGLLGNGTVHLERSHLTMRNFDARITRKGLGFSKKLEMHRLAAAWQDIGYNLCHTVRTLKEPLMDEEARKTTPKFTKKWKHLTPMMAAKITNHVWTVKELLWTIPLISTLPTL